MRILATSDTHLQHNFIDLNAEPHDLLIHAGDGLEHHHEKYAISLFSWMGASKASYKIYVPGNHDSIFNESYHIAIRIAKDYGVTTLLDQQITVGTNKIKIFGSPWTPIFGGFHFMKKDMFLSRYWDAIPSDTDILITHGPPYEILDNNGRGVFCGSKTLLDRVNNLNIKYHIFGHIHESYGMQKINGKTFINASYIKSKKVQIFDY